MKTNKRTITLMLLLIYPEFLLKVRKSKKNRENKL